MDIIASRVCVSRLWSPQRNGESTMSLLEGKVAVVTGASRGIGFAIARRLGMEGATIAAVSTSAEHSEAAAAKLREAGFRDVSANPDWREALAEALDWAERENGGVVVCGALFLAGAVCEHLGALPWKNGTVTPSELLKGKGQ